MEAQVDTKAVATVQAFSPEDSIFFNIQKFEHAQRIAKAFSQATMVPEHYRNNLGNCLIGLNLADRMKADPLMVFQNTYIVHGKPGIEAKLAIALINTSGRFEPLKYEYKMVNEEVVECFAYAKEKATGEVLNGPEVTWKMVQAEGWDKPRKTMQSKWVTMRKLMFTYRAAMFFARVHIPEALLGFYTTEELAETVDLEQSPNGTYRANLPWTATEKPDYTAQDLETEPTDNEEAGEPAGPTKEEKLTKAEELRKEKAEADKQERRESDKQPEKPDMVEWLRTARPSISLKNAQKWLKQYKANEDTIDFLEDRKLRNQLQIKKTKTEKFIGVATAATEKVEPESPSTQEQDERREAFVEYCQEANRVADQDVTQEVLTAFGYRNANDVPEIEFGTIKRGIDTRVKEL